VVFASDFMFELANFRREELHRAATNRAYHVVVAAAIVLMFVTRDAVVESNLAGKSAFGEELQSAVNGGETDLGIFLAHQAEELVRGKMLASFQKGVQDRVALGGVFQANPFEVLVKDLLGLANHLSRDAGLVVNALLGSGRQVIPVVDPQIILCGVPTAKPRLS